MASTCELQESSNMSCLARIACSLHLLRTLCNSPDEALCAGERSAAIQLPIPNISDQTYRIP